MLCHDTAKNPLNSDFRRNLQKSHFCFVISVLHIHPFQCFWKWTKYSGNNEIELFSYFSHWTSGSGRAHAHQTDTSVVEAKFGLLVNYNMRFAVVFVFFCCSRKNKSLSMFATLLRCVWINLCQICYRRKVFTLNSMFCTRFQWRAGESSKRFPKSVSVHRERQQRLISRLVLHTSPPACVLRIIDAQMDWLESLYHFNVERGVPKTMIILANLLTSAEQSHF